MSGDNTRQATMSLSTYSTGHGCWPPQLLITGSNNVRINSLPAGRVGDIYAVHCCMSDCHPGTAAKGSNTVRVNGLPMHRVDDSVSCGGSAMTGSNNVFAG